MTKIADSFSGYLNIDDEVFAYNVSNHKVTLLPAQSDQSSIYKAVDKIHKREEAQGKEPSEFLFGYNGGYRIALLRKGAFHTDSFGINPVIQFATPLIIKSSGNTEYFYKTLSEDWNKFHAITFCGGNINALCSPEIAIERSKDKLRGNDGSGEIRILPWADYSRSISFEIDGEKIELTISISRTWAANNAERIGAYSLGELNSFIRFSFENAQDFDKFEKYYRIANEMIAILTTQSNVSFEVYLSQRNSENLYTKTALCKVFDGYDNYCARRSHEVIPIYGIFDCLPNLVRNISRGKLTFLLSLLPDDNRDAHRITITNIQDLCTALEVAYRWSKRHSEKDALIEELKQRIKETISEFTEEHSEIDIYNQTTIHSAFQYLDYTLKQRITTLYAENCAVIDSIVSKWALQPVNEESIGSFVKLRNSRTHSGIVGFNDSVELYSPLFALVYCCLLNHIGLCEETIKSILLQVF